MTLELPIVVILLLLECRNQRKDRLKSQTREIGEDGHAFGSDNG